MVKDDYNADAITASRKIIGSQPKETGEEEDA